MTRRQILLGGAAGLLLAACGKSDGSGDEASADGSATSVPEAAGGLVLFKVFQPQQPVGVDLRLPLALADAAGSFDLDLPRSVTVSVQGPDGSTSARTTIPRHEQDLPRGYFPLRTRFETAGRWTIVVEAGKAQIETTVDAKAASELPAIPVPGDMLPMIPTPTRASHQGVDPICTRDPICPFHTRSLDEVIGGSEPIVLLVSTPAFCQIAICGPVLDLLVTRKADLEAQGFAVIHAEVYVDESARVTAPTVDALGLDFEPSLFLAAPDGTVTDRLDSIFDGVELDEALARLAP